MCLIIHREQGSNVPNDILAANKTKNPDGFGISWRDADGLRFQKFGPKDYEPFHSLLKQIDKNPNIEYTAHYRFATTGAPCQDLSHPFVYDDPDPEVGQVHIFHNGIISIHADKGESDTSQFVKGVLQKLPSRWWTDEALTFLVESAIGYSRLVVMTKDETVRLDGGNSWRKIGGIWYSTEPQQKAYQPGSMKYLPNNSGKGYQPPPLWTPQMAAPTSDVQKDDSQGWYHEGHWVEAVTEYEDNGEDVAGEAECSECGTIGEFYIIQGTTFIDVPHEAESDDEDSDEDVLTMDQKTMEAVYAR